MFLLFKKLFTHFIANPLCAVFNTNITEQKGHIMY